MYDEERQGRPLAPLVAPPGDDEVHADEGDLEEDVEEYGVQRDEDPEGGRLEQQEERYVGARPLADPRREDERDEEEHRRHEDERQADAINADPVGGTRRGKP